MFAREIKKSIEKINNTFRVLVVTGPRQVGKTTLLKKMMPKNMKMVSLDDESLRKEAQINPRLFLQTFGKPLFMRVFFVIYP
jgi:predicted AAA+ superfamily ATPase